MNDFVVEGRKCMTMEFAGASILKMLEMLVKILASGFGMFFVGLLAAIAVMRTNFAVNPAETAIKVIGNAALGVVVTLILVSVLIKVGWLLPEFKNLTMIFMPIAGAWGVDFLANSIHLWMARHKNKDIQQVVDSVKGKKRRKDNE